MKTYSSAFPGLVIDDDPDRLDRKLVWSWLSQCYWCFGIPEHTLARAIRGSLNFGVYREDDGAAQIAFARVVSDRATFAWLCDVVVDEQERGKGVGAWLVETIIEHPELQGLRRFLLATRDAHELYRRFGFESTPTPDRYMEILDREVYVRQTRP